MSVWRVPIKFILQLVLGQFVRILFLGAYTHRSECLHWLFQDVFEQTLLQITYRQFNKQKRAWNWKFDQILELYSVRLDSSRTPSSGCCCSPSSLPPPRLLSGWSTPSSPRTASCPTRCTTHLVVTCLHRAGSSPPPR